MIIGGGITAYYLAKSLIPLNMDITIIESNYERCQRLSEQLPEVTVIHGDGSDHELLDEEGLSYMDGMVTLTGLDEQNVIISLYASSLGVEKVITKVSHLSFDHLLESIGVDCVVSPNLVSVNHILRYVRAKQNSLESNNIETLYRLVNNKVEAMEFIVNIPVHYLGIPLEQLPLKDNLLIGCIMRDNRIIIPNGEDSIQLNDRVIVVTTNQSLQGLNDILR